MLNKTWSIPCFIKHNNLKFSTITAINVQCTLCHEYIVPWACKLDKQLFRLKSTSLCKLEVEEG